MKFVDKMSTTSLIQLYDLGAFHATKKNALGRWDWSTYFGMFTVTCMYIYDADPIYGNFTCDIASTNIRQIQVNAV